jgi:hypothetical protein
MDRGNPLNLDCGQAKNATDVCIGTLLAMVKLVHNIVSVLRSLCGPPPSKVTLQQNEPILDFVRDGDPSFIYIDSVSVYIVQRYTRHTLYIIHTVSMRITCTK